MPLALTISAAVAGAALFERLQIPAGSLLGAAVAVAAINLAPTATVELPESIRFLAFAAIGWAIGQGVTRETLSELRTSLPVVAMIVVVLLVVGAALAFLLVRTGALDPSTAYLASSPGALAQMVALADDSSADSLLVVTVHTIRIVSVILIAPIVIRALA